MNAIQKTWLFHLFLRSIIWGKGIYKVRKQIKNIYLGLEVISYSSVLSQDCQISASLLKTVTWFNLSSKHASWLLHGQRAANYLAYLWTFHSHHLTIHQDVVFISLEDSRTFLILGAVDETEVENIISRNHYLWMNWQGLNLTIFCSAYKRWY